MQQLWNEQISNANAPGRPRRAVSAIGLIQNHLMPLRRGSKRRARRRVRSNTGKAARSLSRPAARLLAITRDRGNTRTGWPSGSCHGHERGTVPNRSHAPDQDAVNFRFAEGRKESTERAV